MKFSEKGEVKEFIFFKILLPSFLCVQLMNEAKWAEPDGRIHAIIQSETENDPTRSNGRTHRLSAAGSWAS